MTIDELVTTEPGEEPPPPPRRWSPRARWAAAVVGVVALAQRPTIAEVAGIALVMAALVVSAEHGDTVGSNGN